MTRCTSPVATGAMRAGLERELFHDGNPQPTMTLPRQATDFSGVARAGRRSCKKSGGRGSTAPAATRDLWEQSFRP